MRLQPVLQTLDDVPEDFRENYAEVADETGVKTYRLAVLDGYESPEGVEGLRSALQKERAERKAHERSLRALEEKIAALNLDEAEALRQQLAAKDQALANAAAKQTAVEAIQAAAGDIEALVPMILPRLKATKAIDGDSYAVAVVGENGVPLLTEEGGPLSVNAFVATLRARKPNLFKGTGSSGGGDSGEHSPELYTRANSAHLRRRTMRPEDKVKFIRANGEDAYLALPY